MHWPKLEVPTILVRFRHGHPCMHRALLVVCSGFCDGSPELGPGAKNLQLSSSGWRQTAFAK